MFGSLQRWAMNHDGISSTSIVLNCEDSLLDDIEGLLGRAIERRSLPGFDPRSRVGELRLCSEKPH